MPHKSRKKGFVVNVFEGIVLFAIMGFAFGSNLQSANLQPAVVKLSTNANGEEIQKALDSLPNGGEVDLAAGTYVIHEPITLRHDNQVLRGSGQSTILFLADNANCPVIIMGNPMNRPEAATAHLKLADLSIDGNRKSQHVELWRTAVDGSQLMNNGVDIWRVND